MNSDNVKINLDQFFFKLKSYFSKYNFKKCRSRLLTFIPAAMHLNVIFCLKLTNLRDVVVFFYSNGYSVYIYALRTRPLQFILYANDGPLEGP